MVKQHLFEARTGGYHNYRIPGLLATDGGVVLATVEARRGAGGDWDANDLVLRRSTDGGLTFGEPQVLATCATWGPGPASNLVLIDDPARRCIHGVFCHNYARLFSITSVDGGASFSQPREITPMLAAFAREYPWKVIATGPGHGIRLASGRLVVPLWMSDGSGTEFGAGRLGHRPSVVAGIYSDDGGQSWRCTEIVARHKQTVPYLTGTAMIVNPSETLPLELADGRVLFNMRSESAPHRRLVSVSPDGATGWSEPRFVEELLEPVCMASLARVGAGGPVVFVNPDNLDHTMTDPVRVSCDRKRLTAKLSADDGRTWPWFRIIEEGPAGYSDLAVLASGEILCLYECGMVSGMYDGRTVTLARFDADWIREGGGR